MALQAGQMLRHYRLLEQIGEGGMGVVWKALDTVLSRQVALKLLPDEFARDPERLAQLEAEARAVASLNHPGIVTLYSVEQAGGRRFLTMELIEGHSLDEMIPPGGMRPGEFLDTALGICAAVAAAHHLGITHRDLKPANILVTAGGAVKVLDFGLARSASLLEPAAAHRTAEGPTLTRPPEVLAGTIGYMAPEQAQGLPADPRSDVFSLGVLLYQMATGQRPFSGGSALAVITALLRDEPVPPTRLNPDHPARLDRIVARCLEKNPDFRLRTAEEVLWELERMRDDERAQRSGSRSVAVLPFTDLSQEKDQEYFCQGMAEEILVALSRLSGLRVASRPASFACKGEGDVRAVATRLGVAALLLGSVRRSGDRLRVTAELVDGGDGFQLWAERYDRPLQDVFAIQDDIAQEIADALQVQLTAPERDALRTRPTRDIEAYDHYLRARNHFYQYSRRAVERALSQFSHAIEEDPEYARAYAGVADCCAYLYQNAGGDPAFITRAQSASAHALRLDEGLAEAHASRGNALSLAGRHAEAEEEFAAAIRLDPRLFEARYFRARDLFAQGRLQEAVLEYEEARRVRPEDYQAPLLVAQIYDDLGRPDEAAAVRRAGIAAAEERLRHDPEDVRALYMGANGLVGLGERQRGLEWANRALAVEGDDPMVLYNIACIKALAGANEEALDCLERSVRAGMRYRGWLEHDSNLDGLRASPRFEAVMKALD